MIYDNEEYDLISETETDLLLSDLPVDLIKQNISMQINNPLSTNVNYLENIIDRYREYRNEFQENEDALKQLDEQTADFYNHIIEAISGKFDISIDPNTWDNIEDLEDITNSLYRFLILRFRKNITRYLYRFISRNKKDIIKSLDPETKKRDVTSIANKKRVKNKDDVIILSNFPIVISHVLNVDIEANDFISYVSKDDNYDASIIRNNLLSGYIVGNFVPTYFEIIKDGYDSVLDEIHTDVKMKLIKKS